ncbi:hypothetical protein ACO34A_09940 [Rhizobium sp. ACO-34A]|nr:hypothetical protein ACO34A_09940 [Rhizobium sp. ACO-34A]
MSNPVHPGASDITRDPYLSAKQICSLIGCSAATLYNHVKAGHLPKGERVGPKMIRWRQSVVQAYLSKFNRGGPDEQS